MTLYRSELLSKCPRAQCMHIPNLGSCRTFEAGQVAFKRYAHLVNSTQIPYVRAAGAPRVISTAANWTVGFAAASHQRYQPYLNQIISEEVSFRS